MTEATVTLTLREFDRMRDRIRIADLFEEKMGRAVKRVYGKTLDDVAEEAETMERMKAKAETYRLVHEGKL